MPVSPSYQAQPIILELGEQFYDAVEPALFPNDIPRFINREWAARVGLGEMATAEWIKHFQRFEPLPDDLPQPLALRYHGHQFQSYNERLGDGRGFLFAQLKDDLGRTLDLGTKGSGKTPWSRGGDGKLTLKGAMREALATEMLESLGVNTSKTFCFFETGEDLQRNDEPSPTRSAVLTRLSHSHIRFGTFQRHAFNKDKESLAKLVAYVVRHFYPEVLKTPEAEWPSRLLERVTKRTAELCASWMVSGFVHGVLNTDNMSITGESFDYGPYRFLPQYDPEFTAAYFDHNGLYAYGRQPEAIIWNLERLAECLLFLMGDEGENRNSLVDALSTFSASFNEAAAGRFRTRLGLKEISKEKDAELLLAGFNFLGNSRVGFEQFFFDWYGGELSTRRAMKSTEAEKYTGLFFDTFRSVIQNWSADEGVENRLAQAYFEAKKPSTILIEEIEAIWKSIAEKDDWSVFESKIEEIRSMGRLYGRR